MSNISQSPLLQKKSDRFLHQKRQKNHQKPKGKTPHNHSVSRSKAPESFLGVPCKQVVFRVPPKAEREAMRLEFEQEKRAEFIKFLANTQKKALLAAGITEKQIEGMKNGYTPHGFNTHHKLPIFGGGTNDFSNLVLIRREPYHDMMHYHLINPQVRGLQENQQKTVSIPNPETPVFVPSSQYKFLEKWVKKGRKTYGKNKNTSLAEVQAEANRQISLVAAAARKGRSA